MSINSIQELDTLTEAILLQKQFNLDKPPNSWIMQFILQLFDLFFLPFILTILFLILTAPWLDIPFSKFIPNNFVRYVCRALVFLGLTYVVLRVYILNVIEMQK